MRPCSSPPSRSPPRWPWGSDNPGGAFTPTLLIGGCTGALYAFSLHAVLGDTIGSPSTYALVGLAAAMAATTHAR